MFSFLSEFTRDVSSPSTFIVMDAEGLEQPRHYQIVPRKILFGVGGAIVGLALLLLAFIILTPLREIIPGYGTAEMRQSARLNALRVSALQDSLKAQERYMSQLRRIMLGQFDSSFAVAPNAPEPAPRVEQYDPLNYSEPSVNWSDHQQPALAYERLDAGELDPFKLTGTSGRNLPSVALPALPPVEGFVTRGFDARSGHYAIDIAVEEGTTVRSIGDGYVVFADWTYEGGFALAVQHADGFVTVYKHNERLLKRLGDHVRARDAIAISGNTGEISTGPHLHFELWHNGLAQNPADYLVGS